MRTQPTAHFFLVGRDYHLGDLLWLTAVLAEYRRQVAPDVLLVGCPDRSISRILETCPVIDRVVFGEARAITATVQQQYGVRVVLHDLQPLSLARAMLEAWRARLPWLYYRDLWLAARGQWLATFLHLGQLTQVKPVIRLSEADRGPARQLARPYVALAPHTGNHTVRALNGPWKRLKGWSDDNWQALAATLRRQGYETVTLGASGEAPIPGTHPTIGLPIRHAAGVIERAHALITVESGLWYLAAALDTPLVIVPWWLPRSVDWVAPMGIPYQLVPRQAASVARIVAATTQVIAAHAPGQQIKDAADTATLSAADAEMARAQV
jgi:ADP-heptose:LPS heptosyltransferase